MEIRKENINDYSDVYNLNKATFEEDEEAKLVDLLRKSSAFIPELSLVAIIDKKIVGHILFTKIKIIDDKGNKNESLALAPMAVVPSLQKKGIGGQLIKTGLEKARKLNFESVIVLGHEKYYPRFGFKPTKQWGITAPWDVPTNVFMGIELVTDGFRNVKGIVQYPKEFDEV
ncbi:MAG: N-acetyltransferase [Candidatus Marinimicrobia bacterium]|nr:N-acetyltransferase [Candidatus Neomarinimicrobiota bacterium]MBT3501245.1 N-acetyltransferase [Candidatus Neomarinimicrobiota bacterium]MBT3839526.1 N-acetyltransferase [Candidatus Neomarinimicrobiota bacterium]MBT3999427.1 N-acetyltransferase [Candidatus Neomarinimicrobiota bacterium]MBT4282489.1 N-acetyltransferase [Candidatus Neomarinimicrobiota bacterium]